jgi:hypothetical protein
MAVGLILIKGKKQVPPNSQVSEDYSERWIGITT